MAEGENEDGTSKPLVFRLHRNTPRVVREVLLERDWEDYDDCDKEKTEWNLHWSSSPFQTIDHDSIKPWQRLNHHQGTAQLAKKDCLARHLKRMRTSYGSAHYAFSPLTFILPAEYKKFQQMYYNEISEKKSSYWICKPANLSRGRGIFVFNDIKDLDYDCTVVVQKYITNPLLISGYKFDLRIYVCVTSFCPLTVYVYHEGLVRFATEKFSLSSLGNIYAHLTNTSINRLSAEFYETKGVLGNGCKWTLGQFRVYLRNQCVDEVLLWQKVYNIVTKTLLAIAPSVPPSQNCFELFGFDILLDENMKPWLLEVNCSPALSLDSSYDVRVKKNLIYDIIDLLNFKTSDTDFSSLKKLDKEIFSLHSSSPQMSWRCSDNMPHRTKDLKASSSTKNSHSTSEEADDKEKYLCTSAEYNPVERDDETKGVQKKENEIHKTDHSPNSPSLPVPNLAIKRTVLKGKRIRAFPRKTLTSKLREKIVSERLPSTEVSPKLHPITATGNANSNRQPAQWRKTEALHFPLYFISDIDQRPPERVGDFILVFPFNHSSLLASKNVIDAKSIINEISKKMQCLSLERKKD